MITTSLQYKINKQAKKTMFHHRVNQPIDPPYWTDRDIGGVYESPCSANKRSMTFGGFERMKLKYAKMVTDVWELIKETI